MDQAIFKTSHLQSFDDICTKNVGFYQTMCKNPQPRLLPVLHEMLQWCRHAWKPLLSLPYTKCASINNKRRSFTYMEVSNWSVRSNIEVFQWWRGDVSINPVCKSWSFTSMRPAVQNHVDKPSITIKLWLALYSFTAFMARMCQTICLI